jgi:hypothetical protein
VNAGKVPDLTGCTRDDLASLLKEYIRELPEPLFTSALYRQWVDVCTPAPVCPLTSSSTPPKTHIPSYSPARHTRGR